MKSFSVDRDMFRTIRSVVLAGIVIVCALVATACGTLGSSAGPTPVAAAPPPNSDAASALPPTEPTQPLTQAEPKAFVPDVDEPSSRGQISRVTPADMHVTWGFDISSDQQQVVFSGYERDSNPIADLWIIPVSGGLPHKITSGTADGAFSPSFTHDGKFIVYESGGSLWVIRADGTGGRRKIPGSGEGIDVNPDVNANNIVVFTSAEKQRVGATDVAGSARAATMTDQSGGSIIGQSDYRYVIWTSDFEGKDLTQLREGRYPRWSPDGTKIIFQHLGDIWTINADGTDLTQLTWTKDIDEGLASYTPDGKSIVYVSNESSPSSKPGDYQVWIMNSDGSNKTQITQLAGWNSWPLMTTSGLSFLSGRSNPPAATEKYQRMWKINRTDWIQQ